MKQAREAKNTQGRGLPIHIPNTNYYHNPEVVALKDGLKKLPVSVFPINQLLIENERLKKALISTKGISDHQIK